MDYILKRLFSDIYRDNTWGDPSEEDLFYSGDGSHKEEFVSEFVEPTIKFLETFSSPPSVLDLGCGDFSVGSKIRSKCGKYIAADIVSELIEYNKIKYKNLDVEFLNLDITTDNFPDAEIIIVRQVFQHLSNYHIQKALTNISKGNFKYLISAEDKFHSMNDYDQTQKDFEPGFSIQVNRGIKISEPPFNFNYIEKMVLHDGGMVKGFIFQLKP